MPRERELNWEALGIQPLDLASLDELFTEDEAFNAIKQMPTNKAPGPDGFMGTFYKACWNIIKHDFMAVLHSIHGNRCTYVPMINTANVVLIPKKEGAETISDYRPISLVHGLRKIVSKILAFRLAPRMHDLFSTNQSAFICGRSIHDNFLYVRNLARRYHRNKIPMLLFKLDISKAF